MPRPPGPPRARNPASPLSHVICYLRNNDHPSCFTPATTHPCLLDPLVPKAPTNTRHRMLKCREPNRRCQTHMKAFIESQYSGITLKSTHQNCWYLVEYEHKMRSSWVCAEDEPPAMLNSHVFLLLSPGRS